MPANKTVKAKKPRKVKDAMQNDAFITPGETLPSDVIIPIMGPTGVGKSTFINTAMGETVATVGDKLQSCTSTLQHFVLPHPDEKSRRIILVDTPGFDDTFVSDREILRRISVWLARSYNEDMKLAGIIYLHEISQTRMSGTMVKNFTMFKKLAGDDAAERIVLATTKWAYITEEIGRTREQELSIDYWKTILDQGSHLCRFKDTHESAWEIINLILGKTTDNYDALQIQIELVDLQKRIPKTEAGISLRDTLQALLKDQEERARNLKADSRDNPEIQEQLAEINKRIRSTLDQIKQLQVPLSARIMAIFFS